MWGVVDGKAGGLADAQHIYNGHYNGLLRRNQEVCSTRPLAYSKKWNEEQEAAERLSLMQEGALVVIKMLKFNCLL